MRLSLASDAKQFWQGRPLCVTTGCRSADCPATNCKGNEVKAVILLSLTSPLPSNAKRTAVTNYQTVRLSLSILAVGTSSFLTRSVQLIFSIFLQHHISKLARYFWCTLHSVQFQHHTKLCSKCSTLLVSSLNCSPVCWRKEPPCWKLLLPCQSWT